MNTESVRVSSKVSAGAERVGTFREIFVLLLFEAVAVMVAVPADSAVTVPFSSTRRIVSSELVQVRVLSVAFSGEIETSVCRLCP